MTVKGRGGGVGLFLGRGASVGGTPAYTKIDRPIVIVFTVLQFIAFVVIPKVGSHYISVAF
jgi:hypothetical protein